MPKKIGATNTMAKRRKLVARKAALRAELRAKQKEARKGNMSFDEVMEIQEQLNKLPRYSSAVRLRNLCRYDGRPRGYMRAFGMNRVLFRELASEGKIPGVVKSSW